MRQRIGEMQMEDEDVEQSRRAEEQRETLLIREGHIRKDYVDRIDALAEGTTWAFASRAAKGYPPRFVKAIKTALRVATWTFLTGLSVWAIRKYGSLPQEYVNALPGVVTAIIYNVTPNLATTVQSVIQSAVGTAFAVAVSWLLYHLPDPHDPNLAASASAPPICPVENVQHPTDSFKMDMYDWYCVKSTGLITADSSWGITYFISAIIAFFVFSLFVAVTLSLNVVMPFKTFALVSALTFMMNFANPQTSVAGQMDLNNMTSMLTVTVVTQFAGSLIAVLAMLLPPVTATMSAKALAARATKVTTELMLFITEYYCGECKTLRINVYNSQLERNREDMDNEETDLNGAWWEFFDWGSAGVVRNLMRSHLKMLKDLDRRLAVMQIAVLREGFEDSHKDVMREMKEPLLKVVHAVTECLICCTLCAADGRFTEDELQQLSTESRRVTEALEEMSTKWKGVRGDKQTALSSAMRAENFFMLEMSTVGRLVVEFTETLKPENRPTPKNIAWDALMNTCSREKWNNPDFRNFVLRNWISLNIAWWWASTANDFATSVPMNVIFMLTELPGNSVMMNLQKLQASVLGSLAGTVLYRAFHYCTVKTRIAKLSSLFLFEFVAMFIANYTKEFANVGLLLAVYGGGKLMMVCDETTTNGEVVVMNNTEFKSLRFFTYAMLIVTVVDTLLKREAASEQGRKKLLEALGVSTSYFNDFMDGKVAQGLKEIWEETGNVTDKVDALLGEAERLAGPADQEPRMHQGPFKTVLYKDLINRTRSLTLNAQVLIRRCQGASDGGLLELLNGCASWTLVKDDFKETISDVNMVVEKVITYDGFGAMDPTKFGGVLDKSGVDKVDGLKRLEEEVANMDWTGSSEVSLEFSKISRLAVVFECFELQIKDLAAMIQAAVLQM